MLITLYSELAGQSVCQLKIFVAKIVPNSVEERSATLFNETYDSILVILITDYI